MRFRSDRPAEITTAPGPSAGFPPHPGRELPARSGRSGDEARMHRSGTRWSPPREGVSHTRKARSHGSLAIPVQLDTSLRSRPMILDALALKLDREARGDFEGRHYPAAPIGRAASWSLRHAPSDRDIEEGLLEGGLTVRHST